MNKLRYEEMEDGEGGKEKGEYYGMDGERKRN